eukprot:366448-Chlamydomonas_euryale.AAC.10
MPVSHTLPKRKLSREPPAPPAKRAGAESDEELGTTRGRPPAAAAARRGAGDAASGDSGLGFVTTRHRKRIWQVVQEALWAKVRAQGRAGGTGGAAGRRCSAEEWG